MAGAKISKLPKYEDVFEGGNLLEEMNNMLIPISLGNNTIRLSAKDFAHLIYEDLYQDVIVSDFQTQIAQNTNSINELEESLNNKIDNLQESSEQMHQQIVDTQREIDEQQNVDIENVITLLNEKIANLQALSEQMNQQMIANQQTIDAQQNVDIENVIKLLNEKIANLQALSEQIHQQMIANQQVIDEKQNQDIEDIHNTNFWEIYGN